MHTKCTLSEETHLYLVHLGVSWKSQLITVRAVRAGGEIPSRCPGLLVGHTLYHTALFPVSYRHTLFTMLHSGLLVRHTLVQTLPSTLHTLLEEAHTALLVRHTLEAHCCSNTRHNTTYYPVGLIAPPS